MIDWVKRILAPPVFAGDEEKTRVARILNTILWFCIFVWAVSFGLLPLGDQVAEGALTIGGLLLLCGVALITLRAGYVQPVAQGFAFLLWVAATVLVTISGGVRSPEAAGFIVVVMVAGVLSGRSFAALFAGLSLLSALGIFLAERSGVLPEAILPIDARVAMVVVATNVATTTAILYLALSSLNAALARVRRNEQALADSNRDLQAIQASLEDQVAERTRTAEAARAEAEAVNAALEAQVWQVVGLARLGEAMQGQQDLPTLATRVIGQVCQYLDAPIGAFFVRVDDTLNLMGSYAYRQRKTVSNRFAIGEGLVGQAALERQPIAITHVPADYFSIALGMGDVVPHTVLVLPLLYDGTVIGVVELGALKPFDALQMTFLEQALERIAVAFQTARARARIDELLEHTQQQAEELQIREESLRAVNEELESQAASLRASESRLRAQQEELETANAELEERATALREQKGVVDRQNLALRAAQAELEQKAEELARASRYKSEFLANMSHELRTPLNSLLILARMLAHNEEGNLTDEQVESAQIIYNSGTDLLDLINQILDLSKVEAGKMTFHFQPTPLRDLVEVMQIQFAHVAEAKGLSFEVELADDLPESIETDQPRVEQVLKNLLSNAFKFTSRGTVRLTMCRPAPDVDLGGSGLDASQVVAIGVSDTGIGMTNEQQRVVFEAFQQADGSTSRRYGGTGLGLAISRELAANLGGYIGLESEWGVGSTFTLYLPFSPRPAKPAEVAEAQPETRVPLSPAPVPVPLPALQDDRDDLAAGGKVLLIVEDDANFARVVLNYAHKKGFKCLVADDGELGVRMAQSYRPDAIILDLDLPKMSGWDVLDVLKQTPDTRHIPIHIMSVADEDLDAYKMGAMGFLTKPVSQEGLGEVFQKIERLIARKIKSLLLLEDDVQLRHSVKQLLAGGDVRITEAGSGRDALDLLRSRPFDCMILDLNLPDISGFEVLGQIDADESIARCPVIVYTGRELTEVENLELMRYADSVIVKGVKSPERLLDETALFLHRVVAEMPEDKQRAIKRLHDREAMLTGKHILIVDDDMRNAFALSRLLGEKGLKVTIAPDGQKALDALDATPGIDLVLMDIMMPGMDGYEAIRRIRANPAFRTLPILALTAKAMKGDREKSIAAGASDYLPKPVDVDRLFSMLRVWLYR
ncbi:MAG: response regulator [Anaerolineae bacterium]|nr:response regulator [Anaerolineae bacterium]